MFLVFFSFLTMFEFTKLYLFMMLHIYSFIFVQYLVSFFLFLIFSFLLGFCTVHIVVVYYKLDSLLLSCLAKGNKSVIQPVWPIDLEGLTLTPSMWIHAELACGPTNECAFMHINIQIHFITHSFLLFLEQVNIISQLWDIIFSKYTFILFKRNLSKIQSLVSWSHLLFA